MYMQEIKNKNLFIQKAFINNKWSDSDSGKVLEVTNPANNSILGTVPDMGKNETEQAIVAANHAFISWKKTTAKDRYNLLMSFYHLMISNADDLAYLMVLEQGKPLAEAKGEVIYAANFIQWFAEQAKRIHGTIMEAFSNKAQLQYTKTPVGVVGIITPWNFPLAMITRKLAPALAAGCTVVIKPSELTPFSAIALMYLAKEAGIPSGVCNLVTTANAAEVGKVMSDSQYIRKISFTGSTKVGKILLEQSSQTVKRMSMELGGNAPFIVFDDADLEVAITSLIASKYRNSGQTCVCANRILVQEKIHDKFVDLLKKQVESFKVADGLTPEVTVGPLINSQTLEKVESHVHHSVNKGAEVVIGGKRHSLGYTFYEPTILVNVPSISILNEEETFGPVAPIIKFKTEEEAIEIANNTKYGLSAYFCSTNVSRIFRVLDALDSGMIGVNEGILSNEFGPFGGVKESGLGREGSVLGLEEYLENKYSIISY